MRETEKKRRLVQQHMADLKRQRALEAEMKQMAREEALTLALMREEKRYESRSRDRGSPDPRSDIRVFPYAFIRRHLLSRSRTNLDVCFCRLAKHRLAKEAALAKERRSQELAAEAKAVELAEAQCLRNAEITAKEREDERSRQLEAEKRAAEMASREREAYFRELYTPFTPLWGWMWNTLSSEEGQCGEGSKDGGGGGSRSTAWWQGADAPQIWGRPRAPCRSTSKQRARPRPTPNPDTDIDGLNMQTVSVGKMTREVLTLLGLPRESVRDMYEQGKRTATDTEAVVESIQLGRIFTMFEDDQVHPRCQ